MNVPDTKTAATKPSTPVHKPAPITPSEERRLAREAQALLEEKDSTARVRAYAGPWATVVTALAMVFSLFQMAVSTLFVLDAMTLRAWHIIFLLTLTFLTYPARRSEQRRRSSPTLYDALWVAAGLFAFGYLLHNYPALTLREVYRLPMDYVAATVGLAVCFEMARRTVGSLAALAAVFLAYNFLGAWIPGAFGHTGFSWRQVVDYMFWDCHGLLGVGAGVSATYIFLFVLLGAFLKYSGFSDFINDLALTLVGRTPGGPAKASVIASALTGMLNGNALAHVAATGPMAIPWMKRTGYQAEFAAAVEAVASAGGPFAPPVMGAAGFLMAEFLGESYTTVMLAAAIPAFLYYLALLMAVHFQARKLGLKGLSAAHIPAALHVLRRRGHLLLPLIVLLIVMFQGYSPLLAAAVSIVATVAASWLSPATRMTPRVIVKALEEGARGAVGVGAACVILGVIIGALTLTRSDLLFGYHIQYAGEAQIYRNGFFVMMASVILGMRVPGVAAYVMGAILAVPMLITAEVTPLAANMFCLFYACLANIAPPAAPAAYVAAGIARSNPTKASLIAVRLGLAGFLLPFFFFHNSLLLYAPGNPLMPTLWALLAASLGVSALAAGLEGWLLGPCNPLMRLMLLAAAFLTLAPGLMNIQFHSAIYLFDPRLITDAAGLVLFVIVARWSRATAARAK